MNGKYYGQNKSLPKSFLVGNTFKPNSSNINSSRPNVKCIISNKKIKNFMLENKIYFDTKSWMNKRKLSNNSHQKSCIKKVNEHYYSDEVKRYINYRKQPKLIKCKTKELYSKLSNRDKNKLSLNNLLEKRLFMKMTNSISSSKNKNLGLKSENSSILRNENNFKNSRSKIYSKSKTINSSSNSNINHLNLDDKMPK